jgi:hypothetical protein
VSTYHNLSELLAGEGCKDPFSLGRRLYKCSDCGPWLAFTTPNVNTGNFSPHIYYSDAAARGWGPRFWGERCVGVRIGAIVEGSDAYVEPFDLRFPFTRKELWAAVQHVDDEATVLWDGAHRRARRP